MVKTSVERRQKNEISSKLSPKKNRPGDNREKLCEINDETETNVTKMVQARNIMEDKKGKDPNLVKTSLGTIPKDNTSRQSVSDTGDRMNDDAEFTLKKLAEMIEESKMTTLGEMRYNDERMKDFLTKELGGIHNDIDVLKHRMEGIERKPFDTERTVVISGLKPMPSTRDEEIVEEILQKIGLSNLSIANVKRMNYRGRGPGLLKVELADEEQKIELLRAKMRFKDVEQDTWIRSSQTHAERLNDINMRTLLTIIPGGEKWKITANGRLEEKDESRQFQFQGRGRGRGGQGRGGVSRDRVGRDHEYELGYRHDRYGQDQDQDLQRGQ